MLAGIICDNDVYFTYFLFSISINYTFAMMCAFLFSISINYTFAMMCAFRRLQMLSLES